MSKLSVKKYLIKALTTKVVAHLTRMKSGQQSSLRLLHVVKKSGTVGYLIGLSKWYESCDSK
jgi:hypothetical protein